MLVEVEAEEAGKQLAGSSPPDEESQDATEKEGCEQVTQGPSDLGHHLLGLILLGVHWTISGCCQYWG